MQLKQQSDTFYQFNGKRLKKIIVNAGESTRR